VARPNNRSGSNLKPFYILLGLIVLVGVALMVYGARKGSGGAGQASVEPVNLDTLDARALMEKARGVRRGPDDAKLRLMVFSDYTCPGCAHFATNIEPQLVREFVEPGLVQLTYYDFPLGGEAHVHGFLAARAARCAEDQGKFWEYHDRLMLLQSAWAFSRVPPVEQFQEYAQQLGLDPEQFASCLNSDAHAELVTANYQLGQQVAVNGTPTVFIENRQSLQPLDWDVLKAEIQRALGM
jgi:protein-disulfide isomerase